MVSPINDENKKEMFLKLNYFYDEHFYKSLA